MVTKTFTFWTASGLPVLEKTNATFMDLEGRVVRDELCIASDFVQSGGLPIARSIRYVAGPITTATGRSFWLAREWRSEDLGKRGPVDSDFVVTIAPSVRIVGLRNAPPPGTERQLDMNKLTKADLETDLMVRGPPRYPERQGTGSHRLRLAVVCSIAVVAAVLLGAVIATWRRARSKNTP